MMVGAAVTFIAAMILIADIKCSYDIENWWAPLYPNGETVSVEYDLFRPRALGMTTWILETSDDVETVKQFYRDKRLEVLKAEKSRGIAWSDSLVQPLENGPGSRIIISSACGT